MIEYVDICTKNTYHKDGKEQVRWLKCGTLKLLDDGKKFIELNHLPGVTFYCFPNKPKEESNEFSG